MNGNETEVVTFRLLDVQRKVKRMVARSESGAWGHARGGGTSLGRGKADGTTLSDGRSPPRQSSYDPVRH